MPLPPIILSQLRAMRATCEATIWQIDALTAYAEDVVQENPPTPQMLLPPSEKEEDSEEDVEDAPVPAGPRPCGHPPEYRQAAPVMGRPTRGICRLCKQEVQ